MNTRSTTILTVLLFGLVVTATAGTGTTDPNPVGDFARAVRQYAALHQQLDRQLPTLGVTDNAQAIADRSDALASAIRAARFGAREGDIFRPAVAASFRRAVATSLAANAFLPEELLASNLEEADEGTELPVVNGRFPWGRGALMWPCVLDALPALPPELQYRFVGRDLVLLDVKADLVVDILRDAVR